MTDLSEARERAEKLSELIDQDKLTEEDLEAIDEEFYDGGNLFQGYRYLGYIGNSSRNYITDEWVLEAANRLGWTREILAEWMCSKPGRWALDHQPMSMEEMLVQMRDSEEWVRGSVTGTGDEGKRLGVGHVLAEGHEPSTCPECSDG